MVPRNQKVPFKRYEDVTMQFGIFGLAQTNKNENTNRNKDAAVEYQWALQIH